MRVDRIEKIITNSNLIHVVWFSKTKMSPEQIREVVYSSRKLYVGYEAILNTKYFILDSSNCLMKKRLYD